MRVLASHGTCCSCAGLERASSERVLSRCAGIWEPPPRGAPPRGRRLERVARGARYALHSPLLSVSRSFLTLSRAHPLSPRTCFPHSRILAFLRSRVLASPFLFPMPIPIPDAPSPVALGSRGFLQSPEHALRDRDRVLHGAGGACSPCPGALLASSPRSRPPRSPVPVILTLALRAVPDHVCWA